MVNKLWHIGKMEIDYYKQYLYRLFETVKVFYDEKIVIKWKKTHKNHVYSWIMYVNEAVSVFKNTAVSLLSTVLSWIPD